MALSQQFRDAAKDSLLECYSVWQSLPLQDFRRVMRPSGPNTHSISVEPYRGSSTWISFLKKIEKSSSLEKLGSTIAQFQPELLSHLVVPGRVSKLGDCPGLLTAWCRILENDPDTSQGLPQAIERTLNTLEATLESERLTHRVTVCIAGLKLPKSEMVLQLEGGGVLRSLTEAELVEIGAQDVTFGHGHDLLSHSVTCCFELESECSFSLEKDPPQNLVASDLVQKANLRVANVLRACHILKSGRAGIFLSKEDMSPKVFPNLDGGSSWPLQRSIFSSLEILEEEVDAFLQLEVGLTHAGREELRIAADRLVDAENRLSPIDALLDAVIGLEVLLNPMDSSELAFRVALNYAFLSPPVHRRERYDRVRLVQKTRNRVVHGGLNLQSPEAQIIHEHAQLAKACLRDTLLMFLTAPELKGNQKLDADFWLERVLPSLVVPEHAAILPGSDVK